MSTLKKIIYQTGIAIRNPSFNKKYRELKNTEFSTDFQLKNLQRQKLNKLLSFVYNHSDFYRDKLNTIKYTTSDDAFDILKRISITTKEELINNNGSVHTIEKVKFKKLFFSETSGSSGQALTFYKDESWDSSNRASIARGMSWYNVEAWERNGYFWGYSFSFQKKIKTKILDFLLNRFRLFSYDEKNISKFISKAKHASYLHGYSSMIYEVARTLNASGRQLKNLKFLKGTSEKIYTHYQAEAKKAFGCKIISEYGSAETGIIAFECPHGSMHINEETCIVEAIDDHIVVTNLEAYSFPIIRYSLGDYIKLSEKKCSCGRSHRVIEEILGRVGNNIYGRNKEMYPSLTLYYIFKDLAINKKLQLNYKAEQYEIGRLLINIDRELSNIEKDIIYSVAHAYFNNSITIEIKDNQKIHDKTKKLKDFESYISAL